MKFCFASENFYWLTFEWLTRLKTESESIWSWQFQSLNCINFISRKRYCKSIWFLWLWYCFASSFLSRYYVEKYSQFISLSFDNRIHVYLNIKADILWLCCQKLKSNIFVESWLSSSTTRSAFHMPVLAGQRELILAIVNVKSERARASLPAILTHQIRALLLTRT